VTLVEQAPEARCGGYVIDFWGTGYEVAERMGLLTELRRHDLGVNEFRIVDENGRRISGIKQGAMQEITGGRIMSLPRSAVALALYDAVKGRITLRFGDSVTSIQEGAGGLDVQFRQGESGRFDLVFGADGLHSGVRRLVFGEEALFERFLGFYVAAFSAPRYPHRDPHVYLAYGKPGRQIWRITLNDRSVFLLVLALADPLAIPLHDPALQKEILARLFVGSGWETDEVLAALNEANDLYFDRVSQIVMREWTKGRIALLGDACACPSLLAGEGASMAMAEAYTLAGELYRAEGEYERAFRAYELRLRPYVERKQKGALEFANSFVPTSDFGLWMRDISLNVVSLLGLTRLLFRAQFRDPLELGDYH